MTVYCQGNDHHRKRQSAILVDLDIIRMKSMNIFEVTITDDLRATNHVDNLYCAHSPCMPSECSGHMASQQQRSTQSPGPPPSPGSCTPPQPGLASLMKMIVSAWIDSKPTAGKASELHVKMVHVYPRQRAQHRLWQRWLVAQGDERRSRFNV